jgi:hypothetical protein
VGGAGTGGATSTAAPAAQPLRASAALCDGSPDSAFQAGTAFWLFRLESVPPRMMGLLSGTPGLELFTPVGANVAVAYGYRHPIHLDACKAAFPGDRFFLFSPAESGATVLSPPPVFATVEDLVRIRPPAPREPDPRAARVMPRPDFAVPLRLEPFPDYQRHAVAALVPWTQAAWLRRLCYTLPATALRGYRLAVLDRGLLVISGGVLDGIPFGILLDLAAPNLLVPLGARLRPAVSPQILVERTGATGGAMVVFPALGEPPFRVPADAIEPLERRTLADADLGEAARRRPGEPVEGKTPLSPPEPVEIENDRLGPMPLWGIP